MKIPARVRSTVVEVILSSAAHSGVPLDGELCTTTNSTQVLIETEDDSVHEKQMIELKLLQYFEFERAALSCKGSCIGHSGASPQFKRFDL